ncbi:MAG: response regulator transcription factor [Peptostreptococcaceae bacterium]|nr:response regulator transcription factor [Peptostreptococcaceae bacterium]
MGYNLLVVDDEENIRKLIRKYAEFEGHRITEAKDGMEAVEFCQSEEFDLIVLDIMMPELDGFSTAREIRKFSNVPILMLSARGEEYDRIHGFEVGTDDYVIKPFSPKELMMRINAIVKRSNITMGQEKFEYEGLVVNFSAMTVDVDGIRENFSPKEYELLVYLIKNKNIAMSRDTLISKIWGYDFFGDERTLDTHIKLIRKRLGKYSHLIATVRGVGYRFENE